VIEDAGNLIALRDAIHFWSDSSRREAARSANIERASQFDISNNVAQTLEILTRVAV
jgi:hypothetical protein